MTDMDDKELKNRLWEESRIFSDKGDPVVFRINFDKAINEAMQFSRNRELDSLFAELGTLKWMGADKSWDLAITAVRQRLVGLISN